MGTFPSVCELQSLYGKGKIKSVNLVTQRSSMSTTAEKKQKKSQVAVVKKMRDYSNEPSFKKKDQEARAFLEKHGLPETFTKKK